MLRKRKRMIALAFTSIFYFSLIFPPFNSFEVDAIPPAFFPINILVPNNNIELVQMAMYLSEQLPEIGIAVDEVLIADIDYVYNRTYNHLGPYPIPPHTLGGYDIALLEQESDFDFDPIPYFATSKFVPSGKNIYQFSRPEMDWILGNFSQSFVLADRISYAEDVQAILYEYMPTIPIIYNEGIILVNQNFNVNSMNKRLWSLASQGMYNWSIPGQTDFHYAVPKLSSNFHPYFANSIVDNQWLNQVYAGLVERTSEQPYKYSFQPYIANSWTSADGVTYGLQLNPNTLWADGNILNASDVKYSFDLLINENLSHPNFDFYSQYIDNESVVVNSEFDITINFKKHYVFHDSNIGIDLLPKHIWSSISPVNHSETANEWAITQPEKIFGVGPYRLESLDTIDGYIHLTRNTNFKNWTNITPYFENIYFDFYETKEDAINDLNSSIIDMIDSDFNITDYDLSEDFTSIIHETPVTYEVAINCFHPYIGTGELNPINSEDSAKYIRQAINHIISRSKIIFEIQRGLGNPGITPYPNFAIGFNDTLRPYEYTIDIAMQKMELAGFVYPGGYTYTPFKIWPCVLMFTATGIVALFILGIVVLALSTMIKDTTSWVKKEIKKRKEKEE